VTTDEKLAAVVAEAIKQTRKAMPALLGLTGLAETGYTEGAWAAVAAESYDIFRSTFSDEEIDFMYVNTTSDIAKRIAEKQQVIAVKMVELGSRVLGPSLV